MRLRSVILSILLLFGIVPLIALLSLNFPIVLEKFEKAAQEKQLATLHQDFLVLSNLMQRRQESLRVFSTNPGSRELASSTPGKVPINVIRKRFGRMMVDWYQSHQDILHIAIIDGSGKEQMKILRNEKGLLELAPRALQNEVREKMYFREGMQMKAGDVYVGGIEIKEFPEQDITQIIVQLGVPVESRKRKSKGIAVIEFDLTGFLADYLDHIILIGDGTYLYSPKRNKMLRSHPGESYKDFDQLEKILINKEPDIAYDHSGNALAFMPLILDQHTEHSLWVGAPVDVSEVLAWVRSFQKRLIWVLGALFLVLFMIASKFAKIIDTIMQNLVTELSGLLKHESGINLQWKWPLELKQLGQNLNTLSHDYEESCDKIRAAEEHVQTLIRQQKMILDVAAEGILLVGVDGLVKFANPAATSILGYDNDELVGSDLHSLIHPAHPDGSEYSKADCPFCNAATFGINKKGREDIFKSKDGGFVDVYYTAGNIKEEDGHVDGTVMFFSDLEEKKKLEKELFQAHKMEAIGTLAGGIAHDFNNILVAILGYSELARMKLPADSDVMEDVDNVITAGKRATALVKQILIFSRKSDQQKEVFQMNILVQEALKLMKSILPATIKIETNIDRNIGSVCVDPTSIHQIIANLCSNALHAMGDEKGTLEIVLSRVELQPEQVLEKSGVQPGCFVDLKVKDTGKGMNDAIMARIFEPYFTTKEVGAGTGLGLAVIHGIVKECGGFVDVQSILGKGSTFHIYLPIIEEKPDQTLKADDISLPTGNEHILLVDDEPAIVEVNKLIISGLGYKITTAINSTEALEIFSSNPEKIDLVITDQTMPELTGAELAKAMLKVKPSLPIILCTGYSSMLSREEAYNIGIKCFESKPLSKRFLAETIRRVLDQNTQESNA